jgi:predicted N-formylglutamate amidohydrolase
MGGSRGIIGIPDTDRNASPLFRVPRLANALMTISCKSHGTLITSNFGLPRRDRLAEQEANWPPDHSASRKAPVHLEPVRRLREDSTLVLTVRARAPAWRPDCRDLMLHSAQVHRGTSTVHAG